MNQHPIDLQKATLILRRLQSLFYASYRRVQRHFYGVPTSIKNKKAMHRY